MKAVVTMKQKVLGILSKLNFQQKRMKNFLYNAKEIWYINFSIYNRAVET